MTIGIIDYRAGNITSVVRALDFLEIPNFVSAKANELARASRIIFPGVGAAGAAMMNLREMGLDAFLKDAYLSGVPILGICLGTQIIMESSEEDGGIECLGIIRGKTRAFSKEMMVLEVGITTKLKIPHIGWNVVSFAYPHPVFAALASNDEFYFVHSYYPNPAERACWLGITNYGIEFCSAIAKRNLVAVQFHPEKSGKAGLKILQNFSNWQPNGADDAQ